MKKGSEIWKRNKGQVLVIVGSLYFFSAITLDFRTSLFPDYYNTADAVYAYLIWIISICCLCLALFLILRNLTDYFKHFERIINHDNRWIYYSARIVIVFLFLKTALDLLYPSASELTELYFIFWFVINGCIVVPMVVIMVTYKG